MGDSENNILANLKLLIPRNAQTMKFPKHYNINKIRLIYSRKKKSLDKCLPYSMSSISY